MTTKIVGKVRALSAADLGIPVTFKVYIGRRDADLSARVVVHHQNRSYRLPLCLKHVNHSPDGFEWGYAGSGPAQLAFALLADAMDLPTAHALYQRYKDQQIVALPRTGWTLTSDEIQEWVEGVRMNCGHMGPGVRNLGTGRVVSRCELCGSPMPSTTEE